MFGEFSTSGAWGLAHAAAVASWKAQARLRSQPGSQGRGSGSVAVLSASPRLGLTPRGLEKIQAPV